jgi:putative membrane-bound dehydrogenase-like protein
MMRAVLLALLAASGLIGACGMAGFPLAARVREALQEAPTARQAPRSPLSPEAEQATFAIEPGYTIELVAAEPDVQSPVALAFDARNRLWVVEMLDYPNGPAPGKPAEGRIVVLEDGDGDGRYTRSAVFADELLFANGILPWRDGVIVTQAPRILWLRDTDGDLQCDTREVWLEGFATENPQLRVSHPILGLDGWVIVANGLRGGKIRDLREAQSPILDLSGHDLKFDPLAPGARLLAGMGQYGNTLDAFGQRFVCTNRNHLVPIQFEERYAARNPWLVPPGPLADNQNAGGAAKVYPLSRQFTTSSLHVGSFSAACGVHARTDDGFVPAGKTWVFTCEPTGNLVHAEEIRPEMAGLIGQPIAQGREFLATPDEWCRPVFLADGPDGALYMADMYRAVIEHPEWMPEELKHRADLNEGKNLGRIWRIRRTGEPAGAALRRPLLAAAAPADWVRELASPIAWRRTTAQRLLLEHQGEKPVAALHAMVSDPGAPAVARVHAAWLLERFGKLEDEEIVRLLQHAHPRVREQGLVLAESRLASAPGLAEAARALARDGDPRVRCQAALSLGFLADEGTIHALVAIATRDAGDARTRLAIASGRPETTIPVLQALLQLPTTGTGDAESGQARAAIVEDLATLVGRNTGTASQEQGLTLLSHAGDSARLKLAAVSGLAAGLRERGARLGALLAARGDDEVRRALRSCCFEALESRSGAESLPARVQAVRLLPEFADPESRKRLAETIADAPEPELRMAAARAAASLPDDLALPMLIPAWAGATPALRGELAEILASTPARANALLDAVEQGGIAPTDLPPAIVRRLAREGSGPVRTRAEKLLQSALPADRSAILAQYASAAEQPGDPARGAEVFQRVCATCHRIGGRGVAVGPDISDTRVKTSQQLLMDILHPNAAIDANYVAHAVALQDGRVLTGLIAGETSAGLILRRAEAQEDRILRSDVEEIRSTGISLMPEGLEKDITVSQMADLIAFLKNYRYIEAEIPLGKGARP